MTKQSGLIDAAAKALIPLAAQYMPKALPKLTQVGETGLKGLWQGVKANSGRLGILGRVGKEGLSNAEMAIPAAGVMGGVGLYEGAKHAPSQDLSTMGDMY